MHGIQLTHDYMPFLIESIVATAAATTLFLTLLLPGSRHELEEDSSPATISFDQSSGGDFDFYGSITLLIAVITPLVALNLGGNLVAWNHPAEIALLCSTLLLFAFFAYLEVFRVKSPLLPLHLFRSLPILKVIFCMALIIFARNQVCALL